MTDDYAYSPFGESRGSTGGTDNPYTWVGEHGYRLDPDTGEYNLRARDYDPHAARFLSVDPLGLESGDSNFYRYVFNNSVNEVDPSGLQGRGKPMEARPKPAPAPPAPEPAEEIAFAHADLARVPEERIKKAVTDKSQFFQLAGRNVAVLPMIIQRRIVQAVFVENSDRVLTGCYPGFHGSGLVYSDVSDGTYRLAGVGPSQMNPMALAETTLTDAAELVAAQGNAQTLTAVLHVLPFGTAADYAVCGADSGVGAAELLIVTVADSAMLVGAIGKLTAAGGKAVLGTRATILARGAVIGNTVADVGQTGMAVAQAVDDPTAGNIAIAAGIATAVIFGVAWKATGTAIKLKTAADFPNIGKKISQKQLRHIKGRKEYRGGGYFATLQDAQAVLDAFHSGKAQVIGTTSEGFPVVRYSGVTGTNVNVGAGFPNQPTNVFIIKGTASPSVVPTSPACGV